jgi:hypothetical protein
MEDMTAKLEKLLNEAEDCELIGRLATDLKKRELFKRLAVDLRSMARDIETLVAGRATDQRPAGSASIEPTQRVPQSNPEP